MVEFLDNIKTFFSKTDNACKDWLQKNNIPSSPEETVEFVKENKEIIGALAVTGVAAKVVAPVVSNATRNLRYRTRSLKYRIKNIFRRCF